MENMTHRGHIEGKQEREMLQVIYINSLCKCLVEMGLGEIAKILINFFLFYVLTKFYKLIKSIKYL